jgi:hypothetical protein
MAGAAVASSGAPRFDYFPRLEVVGFSLLMHARTRERASRGSLDDAIGAMSRISIPQVTYLDVTHVPMLSWGAAVVLDETRLVAYAGQRAIRTMAAIFPNVRELDASSWKYRGSARCLNNAFCRRLEKLTLRDHIVKFQVVGAFNVAWGSLKELNMDFTVFDRNILARFFGSLPRTLERLSIKGARVYFRSSLHLLRTSIVDPDPDPPVPTVPVPQELLVELAELLRPGLWPNFRWFRSDLAPENVAALQSGNEHPGVTFAA